jgi:hypothetical protein
VPIQTEISGLYADWSRHGCRRTQNNLGTDEYDGLDEFVDRANLDAGKVGLYEISKADGPRWFYCKVLTFDFKIQLMSLLIEFSEI